MAADRDALLAKVERVLDTVITQNPVNVNTKFSLFTERVFERFIHEGTILESTNGFYAVEVFFYDDFCELENLSQPAQLTLEIMLGLFLEYARNKSLDETRVSEAGAFFSMVYQILNDKYAVSIVQTKCKNIIYHISHLWVWLDTLLGIGHMNSTQDLQSTDFNGKIQTARAGFIEKYGEIQQLQGASDVSLLVVQSAIRSYFKSFVEQKILKDLVNGIGDWQLN